MPNLAIAIHLQCQNDKALQFISQNAGRPRSADTCIYTLYSWMVFQRRKCTIKINPYKGLICCNCIYNLRKWHSWYEVLDPVVEYPWGPPKVSKVPIPPPPSPPPPFPMGQTPQSWLSPVAGREPPLAVNVGHTPCLPHPQPSPAWNMRLKKHTTSSCPTLEVTFT